jgi:hypothetical protein
MAQASVNAIAAGFAIILIYAVEKCYRNCAEATERSPME